LIFSLNYTADDFQAVADRFVAAVRTMHEDGWWWADASSQATPIKRQILREIVSHVLTGRPRQAAPLKPAASAT
jgi:glutamate-1-semialdehyde 2,1-aminomutase